MKMSIFLDALKRQKSLAKFIGGRAKQALKRFERFVGRVEISIRDVNGSKGGIDKECKIVVPNKLSGPVIVKATHTDAGQAFRAALRKIVISLNQKLDRTVVRDRRTRDYVRALKQAV